MRGIFLGSVLGAILAVLAIRLFSPGEPAQNSHQSEVAMASMDLSGIWRRRSSPSGGAFGYANEINGEELPMQPWARERYMANWKGGFIPNERAPEDSDPNLYPFCMPAGMPRAYSHPYHVEIVQVPGRVYMLFELNSMIRRIYTDGRDLPEGAPLSFMGNSVGRWDGDTLVVDTIDMNETTWLDRLGHPHTEALRVEERIRRVAHDTIEVDFRFEDAKAYTKPWTGKHVMELKPDYQMIDQIICEDRLSEDFRSKVGDRQPGP